MDEIIRKIDLNNALKQLNELEYKVIHMRFSEEMTQREVANRLGYNQAYISRIEKKSLYKLKKYLK